MCTVAIITPTTGSVKLRDCIASVAKQDYPNIAHYVVIDGTERREATNRVLEQIAVRGSVIQLPDATGLNNYFGHRIYSAIPAIANVDFIGYLDEDNFLDHDHVSKLVSLVSQHNLDWAYSLRKIVSDEGKFVTNDDCQSLGWWPAIDGTYHHVDTNCYFIKRCIAVECASVWDRKGYVLGLRDPDRELCRWLMYHYPDFFTTGCYTTNYRLKPGSPGQRRAKYFVQNNAIGRAVYAHYPWAMSTIAATDHKRNFALRPNHAALNAGYEGLIASIPTLEIN